MNMLRYVIRRPIAALLVLLAVAVARPATAADPAWHAAGWTQRAVVSVTQPEGQHDVAAVNVLHAGRAAAEGKDYRIFDSAGQPVPYEVTFHHPARDSWISFRTPPGQKEFAIYYGKSDAPIDPQRAMPEPLGKGPPHAGPAAGGWIPRSGLLLTTMRRDRQADNPKSVPQMLALVAGSPGLEGAAYRTAIADSFNPFGDSDYSISVYRGWIEIPAAGNYGFCTASNEASFSFLDGKDLVHWPGRHTEQRGKHGEYNASRELSAGPHYVEYLQEEVLLYQLAFLGYRPPGSAGFEGIPEAMFPLPRTVEVTRYEQADGKRGVTLRPELVDNVWPKDQSAGQFTRYRFSAAAGTAATDWQGWTLDWDFGDGITASGPSVEHVFLRNGDYPVKLTASSGDTRVDTVWPLVVFPIEHLGGPFREGRIEDYAPIVQGYDAARLQGGLLGELVRFLAASGQQAGAEKLAETILSRSDLDPAARAEAHLMLAGDAGMAETVWTEPLPADRVTNVVEHLQTAIPLLADPTAKVRAMARLVRVRGVEQHDVAAASTLYKEGLEFAQPTKQGDRPKPATLRDLHLAMGDALIVAKSPGKAATVYREAEQLAETPVPVAVRAAKIGAYPENLAQQVAAKNLDDAWTVVREWIDEFPADQTRGTSLFWLGKLELLRGKPLAALRPLTLAVALGEGSDVEAEARWLLAETYRQLGDNEKQKQTLEALVAAGLAGPYRDQALAALGKK
ncbi:MAG TPA: PKD domain-containing protein [Pirellulales bacterium]|jgi:TolA-binding protein|nr:PKD domain-containing protein [Pirellulales bacterium]